MAPPRPRGLSWRFQSQIILYYNFLGDSQFSRAFTSHYWFKSYNNFGEWLDFAYWWSFSGVGQGLQSMGLPRLVLPSYQSYLLPTFYLNNEYAHIYIILFLGAPYYILKISFFGCGGEGEDHL